MELSIQLGSGPEKVALEGCVFVPNRHDAVVVRDEFGRYLLSGPAPPFVARDDYERYAATCRELPGVSFSVKWHLREWPERGEVDWIQHFRNGREVDRPLDQEVQLFSIECSYSALVAFLVGGRPIEDLASIHFVRGGVGFMSCLSALVLDRQSLRIGTTSAATRSVMVTAFTNPVGEP